MTGRMSRNNSKRKISQVGELCSSLPAAKKPALDIKGTPNSMQMECFEFFDKNQPTHTLTQVEFIAMNGRTDAKKSHHKNVVIGRSDHLRPNNNK